MFFVNALAVEGVLYGNDCVLYGVCSRDMCRECTWIHDPCTCVLAARSYFASRPRIWQLMNDRDDDDTTEAQSTLRVTEMLRSYGGVLPVALDIAVHGTLGVAAA